jgi:hypothetical protein
MQALAKPTALEAEENNACTEISLQLCRNTACSLQGVLLTHRALVSVTAATKAFLDQISPNIANGESIDQNDVILSYLPLVSPQVTTAWLLHARTLIATPAC